MSHILSRISNISPKNIISCNNNICICVEYFDLNDTKMFERYKQCFITHEINSKYEKTKQQKNGIYGNSFQYLRIK